VAPHYPSGLAAGDRVTVMPDDYAFDPVVGEVAHLDAADIGIRRRDPALGDLVVHFPRAGFAIDRA
jgi:glutathione S-transferase